MTSIRLVYSGRLCIENPSGWSTMVMVFTQSFIVLQLLIIQTASFVYCVHIVLQNDKNSFADSSSHFRNRRKFFALMFTNLCFTKGSQTGLICEIYLGPVCLYDGVQYIKQFPWSKQNVVYDHFDSSLGNVMLSHLWNSCLTKATKHYQTLVDTCSHIQCQRSNAVKIYNKINAYTSNDNIQWCEHFLHVLDCLSILFQKC